VQDFFDCLTLEVGIIDCPETSVVNHYSTTRKIPRACRSRHILC